MIHEQVQESDIYSKLKLPHAKFKKNFKEVTNEMSFGITYSSTQRLSIFEIFKISLQEKILPFPMT